MSHTLAFDWEADYLAGIVADVSGDSLRVNKCFRIDWPDDADLRQRSEALGRWLAESMRAHGIAASDVHVVMPREAIVVRKLELPNAPDDELPDLVRFQAATKSSTPLDRLTLDYLPLPMQSDDATRQVLMVTIDGTRLRHLHETLAAANIDLLTVGISPVSVGEVVTRIGPDHSVDPNQVTLVIFQDAHRVEITALIQQQVFFSHHTRLAEMESSGGRKSSLAEINRTIVALSQSLSNIEIARVCLIHPGNADPAVEEALQTRFGQQLQVLDVSQARGLIVDPQINVTELAAFTPALGALLGQTGPHVSRVDFLDPRRAVIPPDRTRIRAGLAAAACLLVTGVGYWMFSSYLTDLEAQTLQIEQQVEDLDAELRQGLPDQNAAALIGEWVERNHDPLAVIEEFNRLAPGTDRLYLRELKSETLTRDAALRVTAVGYAVSQQDVEQLQEVLEDAGFRVLPSVADRSRVDPDYPYAFELQIEVPVSKTDQVDSGQRVTLN
ncbi:MAG: hypothetical protein KDA86_04225 [Planctomycetaceae bacterium]|nr:hypothetical protein [Planctomycetaceae bacterium]